ncbi:hypothetical protein STEG23_009661 [Scotinomys teguina]
MAWKAGQGKEEEEYRARQQKEKTPVRDEEKTPARDGRGHHVVEQVKISSHLYMKEAKTKCSSESLPIVLKAQGRSWKNSEDDANAAKEAMEDGEIDGNKLP